MGLEHALGISPYSLEELALKEQPLPDLLNFRFGSRRYHFFLPGLEPEKRKGDNLPCWRYLFI